MKQALLDIKEKALAQIEAATESLEEIRVGVLGKKGELTAILKQMGKLSAEERPVIGQLANQVRADIEAALTENRKNFKLPHCKNNWLPKHWMLPSPATSR